MTVRKVIATLGALYSLFSALSILFGWSQRFGWKSSAGKLATMLSGKPLKQYQLWKAITHFAYAGWFTLCYFYQGYDVRLILLALITAALVGVDQYFRRFTATC